MRVSCRTSFSHATLSGIDSGHVFVPRANYCRLIFKLGCISDLSPKEVIQSHLPLIQLRLVYDTTIPNTLPIEELVIWIRLLLQFCSDFGELDECLAQRYSRGLIIRGRLFGLRCAVSRTVADASHFCNPPLQCVTENCAVLQPKNFPTVG
jgi:hypothetical protein